MTSNLELIFNSEIVTYIIKIEENRKQKRENKK